MNKQRRKTLNDLYEKIADIRDVLEEVKDEEECYRDNMPENLQSSEMYERADAACDLLDDAIRSLDEALGYIESATE